MLLKSEQISFIIGWYFKLFQYLIGMYYGQTGVDYYAEVHTSFWNSCIHTIFMPFTMLGFYIMVPAIIDCNLEEAIKLRRLVIIFYLGLHCNISMITGILIYGYYYPIYIYSNHLYKINMHKGKKYLLKMGLIISIVSLLIQEIIGHYIGNDDRSRIEAIPNAIFYAQYYSVAHLLRHK